MNIITAIFCVFLFSLTAPFTRIAALETTPETIILFRILGAALVCLISVLIDKWIPPKKAWPYILYTSIGSVFGFNAFMAYGLRQVPSSHAAVALAALPLMTAIYSVLRDRRNPGLRFWIFAFTGTAIAFGFFFSINVTQLSMGDIFLLCSVFMATFGYVEGGRISREFGGRKIMSWAVLLATPLTIVLALIYFPDHQDAFLKITLKGWASISYLALISQSLGMFLWFRVLSVGPMEKIALTQLLQPFLTLFASILFLQETVLPLTWVIAFLVAICIFGSNKTKNI